MRFMMLVKHAENAASSGAPPKEFMDAMTKLSEEAVKQGRMVASGGLSPTAMSTRVRLSGGQVNVNRRAFHGGQGNRRRICDA